MMLYALRVVLLVGVLLALLLAVSGCASKPPAPPPPVTTVPVPVPVPCRALAEVPRLEGVTADSDLKKMAPGRFVLALGADRAALLAWARTAEAAIRGCAQ